MLTVLKESLAIPFRWMFRKITHIIALTFFGVSISAGLFFVFGPSGPLGHTENLEEVEIYLPEGSGLAEIAQELVRAKVLSHGLGFMLKAMANDQSRKLQAGEYLVTRKMPLRLLITKIATGDIIHRTITILEGSTVKEIVTQLNENKLLKDEITEIPPEGTLFPATYPFHRGESRLALLKRMRHTMSQAVADLWEKRSPICPFKTPEEAVVMASIIEKESSKKREEQPRIAGVFINRLYKEKMKLQSDPTVIYAMTLGRKTLGRRLTYADLKYNSPYNTYKHPGLPPAPIACPGKTALEAAMNPQKHDDLYFVANGTGGHAFAKTLGEHNKNVQKWREIRAIQPSGNPEE